MNQPARFHSKCGRISERYQDGECTNCSIARKAERREGKAGTRTISVGDVDIMITVRRRA